MKNTIFLLKGQCHEIFDFWFFSWISFPQAPEYTIRAVSNFSKIRGDIRSSRCTTAPVSLTPVANLPPVPLILVVHLDLRISPRAFEEIKNGPNGILWGWGKTVSWKKTRVKKSRDAVPLNMKVNYLGFDCGEPRVWAGSSALSWGVSLPGPW